MGRKRGDGRALEKIRTEKALIPTFGYSIHKKRWGSYLEKFHFFYIVYGRFFLYNDNVLQVVFSTYCQKKLD